MHLSSHLTETAAQDYIHHLQQHWKCSQNPDYLDTAGYSLFIHLFLPPCSIRSGIIHHDVSDESSQRVSGSRGLSTSAGRCFTEDSEDKTTLGVGLSRCWWCLWTLWSPDTRAGCFRGDDASGVDSLRCSTSRWRATKPTVPRPLPLPAPYLQSLFFLFNPVALIEVRLPARSDFLFAVTVAVSIRLDSDVHDWFQRRIFVIQVKDLFQSWQHSLLPAQALLLLHPRSMVTPACVV